MVTEVLVQGRLVATGHPLVAVLVGTRAAQLLGALLRLLLGVIKPSGVGVASQRHGRQRQGDQGQALGQGIGSRQRHSDKATTRQNRKSGSNLLYSGLLSPSRRSMRRSSMISARWATMISRANRRTVGLLLLRRARSGAGGVH